MDKPSQLSPLDDLVKHRRSVRAYKKELPPSSAIEQIIACTAQAPSPSNQQPIRFIEIRTPSIRDSIYQTLETGYLQLLEKQAAIGASKKVKNRINLYWRYSSFIAEAPVLFAVGYHTAYRSFSNYLKAADLIAADQRRETDVNLTIGLALGHFTLKAQELGLSTCILTAPLVLAPDIERTVATVYGQSDIVLKCLLTLGYAAETPAAPPKKRASEISRVI